MDNIRQVHHPWWAWEDHQDGMYGAPCGWQGKIQAARELLTSPRELEDAMRAVVDAWPVSAEHQLTNTTQNRRSWLGQAACRLARHAPAVATRAAWAQLADGQCAAANACAERVIREWQQDYAGCHQPGLCGEDWISLWDEAEYA